MVHVAPHDRGLTVPKGITIVGAGIAEIAAADELRAHGYDGKLTVLSAEEHLPYDRPPLSKDFLLGGTDAEGLLPRPSGWYVAQDIDLQLGVSATEIRPGERAVAPDDGGVVTSDIVLLATGGVLRRSVPGSDPPGLLTFRTVNDAVVLRERLGPDVQIGVIGAGLIGADHRRRRRTRLPGHAHRHRSATTGARHRPGTRHLAASLPQGERRDLAPGIGHARARRPHGLVLLIDDEPELLSCSVAVRSEQQAESFTAIPLREGRCVGTVGINRPAEIRALRRLIELTLPTDPGILADPATDLRRLISPHSNASAIAPMKLQADQGRRVKRKGKEQS